MIFQCICPECPRYRENDRIPPVSRSLAFDYANALVAKRLSASYELQNDTKHCDEYFHIFE